TTRDAVDVELELEDLGEHQLPGLPDLERIYQLNVPGLPTRFPELEFARRGMRGVRVVLAEDSVLLREGIARLLEDQGFEVAAQGGSRLGPAVVSQRVGRRRRDDPLEELTPREREVLELMDGGRSNQAIADSMVITLRAVEKHVMSIFSKLRLSSTDQDHRRVLAVLTFLKE